MQALRLLPAHPPLSASCGAGLRGIGARFERVGPVAHRHAVAVRGVDLPQLLADVPVLLALPLDAVLELPQVRLLALLPALHPGLELRLDLVDDPAHLVGGGGGVADGLRRGLPVQAAAQLLGPVLRPLQHGALARRGAHQRPAVLLRARLRVLLQVHVLLEPVPQLRDLALPLRQLLADVVHAALRLDDLLAGPLELLGPRPQLVLELAVHVHEPGPDPLALGPLEGLALELGLLAGYALGLQRDDPPAAADGLRQALRGPRRQRLLVVEGGVALALVLPAPRRRRRPVLDQERRRHRRAEAEDRGGGEQEGAAAAEPPLPGVGHRQPRRDVALELRAGPGVVVEDVAGAQEAVQVLRELGLLHRVAAEVTYVGARRRL
mmetsp:Transcript_73194/g.206977  ORF Transcript_73194/g.206977 Transcript_73194/m.206977 type:complete len:380 (+) Transcript_73194:45-1184(+)